jgi:hypothetical protein
MASYVLTCRKNPNKQRENSPNNKRLFRKAKDSKTDPNVSILENRTTPLKCGKSPSQLLMSK